MISDKRDNRVRVSYNTGFTIKKANTHWSSVHTYTCAHKIYQRAGYVTMRKWRIRHAIILLPLSSMRFIGCAQYRAVIIELKTKNRSIILLFVSVGYLLSDVSDPFHVRSFCCCPNTRESGKNTRKTPIIAYRSVKY